MFPLITSQKVAIPAILFLALSPGMILKTDGTKISFKNMSTDRLSVFFHGLVFFLVYSLIAKAMGIVLTQNDLLVTTPSSWLSALVCFLPFLPVRSCLVRLRSLPSLCMRSFSR